MSEEIWKDIPGYEGEYQVSNMGRVKTLKDNREKILKGGKDKNGYLLVNLCKNGKQKTYKIHRLVVENFMGKPLDKDYYSVNHIDEDKTNNKLENLQYCTIEFNNKYGTRLEKISKTMTNNIKTSKSVIGINEISGYICEFPSTREAERITGIYQSNISACCKGKYKSAGGYRWYYVNNKEGEQNC